MITVKNGMTIPWKNERRRSHHTSLHAYALTLLMSIIQRSFRFAFFLSELHFQLNKVWASLVLLRFCYSIIIPSTWTNHLSRFSFLSTNPLRANQRKEIIISLCMCKICAHFNIHIVCVKKRRIIFFYSSFPYLKGESLSCL